MRYNKEKCRWEFEVGDVVRTKQRGYFYSLKNEMNAHPFYIPQGMSNWANKVTTISEVRNYDGFCIYKVEADAGEWWWSDLEFVKPNTKTRVSPEVIKVCQIYNNMLADGFEPSTKIRELFESLRSGNYTPIHWNQLSSNLDFYINDIVSSTIHKLPYEPIHFLSPEEQKWLSYFVKR